MKSFLGLTTFAIFISNVHAGVVEVDNRSIQCVRVKAYSSGALSDGKFSWVAPHWYGKSKVGGADSVKGWRIRIYDAIPCSDVNANTRYFEKTRKFGGSGQMMPLYYGVDAVYNAAGELTGLNVGPMTLF